MLNTKFDLYKTEWLDLVFDDRNKAYGAYDLRRHYADHMNRAMAIAFGGIVTAAVFFGLVLKPAIPDEVHTTVVTITPMLPPPVKLKARAVEPIKPIAPKPASAAVKMSAFPPMKIVPEEVKVDPPVIASLGQNIAATASAGTGTVAPVDPPATVSGGGGVATTEDKSIYDFRALEVMPEPAGGFAAFGRFLGNNLRFPAAAQDAGVAGRVVLSFVIEKDGAITNITIDKPAGYGFDQEATRVLKLAKAWKPGKQNGQAVRVRYSIPINFQLPAE